jgi:Tfp pilus assembly protein PilF
VSRGEERLWERARKYVAQGQATAARIALETLIQRAPANPLAHLQLGAVACAEERLRERGSSAACRSFRA